MNEKMADFVIESALKDMGIEAEMKEMAIIREDLAKKLIEVYRQR